MVRFQPGEPTNLVKTSTCGDLRSQPPEITLAILVEYRGKLSREPYTRAKPDSKRSIIEGEAPRYTRTGSTVNRFLAYLSHVLTVARREWHWI